MTKEELTRIMDEIKLVEKAFDRYKEHADKTILTLTTALLWYADVNNYQGTPSKIDYDHGIIATAALSKAGLL